MSKAKKKGGPGALSRQASLGPSALELEERARDEMCSIEAIYADDYTLVSDTPGQPLHFQVRVRPLPNEPDAANFCIVLLDVMLVSSSPMPLLVLRKAKGVADALVEELQKSVDAEAQRLIAKGEEAIVYQIVCFLTEALQPYNVAPKSFHQQMTEREANAERIAADQAAAHMEQQAAVRHEEKEALKKSIEAANAKKQEKLLAVTAAAGRKAQQGAGAPSAASSLPGAGLSSRSITASPASVAASPAMLSSSPPFLPSFNLGASAAAAAPAKKSKASAAASAAHAAASSVAVPASSGHTAAKSAAMSIPKPHAHAHGASVKVGGGGGGGGKKDAADPPKVRRDARVKLKAKAQDKAKGRHKPRELREAASDNEGAGSDKAGGGSSGESDEDDSAGSGASNDESEDEEDEESASGSEALGSEDEESLFGTPGTSLTDKPSAKAAAGANAGASSLDKLMQEIEARDAAANKARVKAAASLARKKLLRADVSVSDLSGATPADDDDDDDEMSDSEDEEDDETDEDDEDEDAEEDGEEDNEEDRSPTPAVGVAGAAWMERNVSGNSDHASASAAAASLPKPPPALPYYSRFHTDFETVELLGKGGFGEVFKVRNKVDRLYYAVKRIKLTRKNHALNQKIIKEVSFIAMLHHRYIVRYYQAWIEGEENNPDASAAAAAPKPKAKPPKPPGLLRRKSTKSNFELAGGEDDEDWLASSHPSTRVANDDEDDEESDEEDEEEDDDSKTAAPLAAGRQYLYIQMEYCANQTLRDVIDSKTASMEDCWRLFRQLLEAVAYIHKRGILHRDLKPANVFISLSDSISQVKLGDFGLAVLSSVASGANSSNGGGGGGIDPDNGSVSDLETTGALSRQSSINECVGTHFYSAPEQAAQGVTYDHRVDMYSCGIILFEMVYPFGSLMERALQLEELRSTGKVPNEFLVGRPDRLNIIKIIESLLKHRPEDRPSAAELLKSGLIPLKVEDELVEEALKSVATRDSLHHTRLLDILFGMPPESTIDFTFDYLSVSSRGGAASQGEGALVGSSFLGTASSSAVGGGRARLVEPPLHFQALVQMKVFDTLTHLFRNHGAIHLSPPIVTPKSSIGGASNAKVNAAVYLDPQGTLIKLPYTLTVPFARYIAQQSAWTWSGGRAGENLDASLAAGSGSASNAALAAASAAGDSSALADFHFDLRRYEISKVYRKNIIGGRPREMYECGFDIVWSNAFANQMAGAGATASAGSASASSSSNALSASSSKSDARTIAREKLVCLSAELIKLTCDVLTEFMPAIGTAFTIKINHADLFESVLDVVLAEPNTATAATSSSGRGAKGVMTAAARQAQREDTALLRKQLCKLASSYALFSGSWQKSPMRRQLLREKKLASSKIDLLGALFSLKSEPGKPEGIFPKIRDTLFSSPEARAVLSEQKLLDQFDYIRSVFAYLKVLHHSDAHVVFDLSICGKHDLFSGGMVFQALVPNTNFDLGTGAASAEKTRSSDAPNTPEDSAGIFSRGGGGGGGGGGAESQTQNAYETLALGGQYDALIAGFMPPTASVPLSALGVNFAVEKIVSAVVYASLKSSDSKSSRAAAINPVHHRRIKKSLYGGDLHSSNILLFSSRNGLLKERLCLADALWTDHLPCLYIHPPHLNLGNLRLYAKEYMIRFLVVFRRQEFRDTAQVHVIDLAHGHASGTKLEASGQAAAASGSKSSKGGGGGGGDKDDASCWVNVNEVPSYLRSKLAGKGSASDSSAASASSSSSHHHHSSSGSNSTPFFHAHSQAHRKPEFFVHIVDAGSFKVNVKNTILANVKRALNAVLGSAGNPAPGSAVCAVDLPFALIRALTSAVYAGGSNAAVHAVLEESHAKHRAVAETLVSYINKKSGGALSNADAASTGGGGGGGSGKQGKSSAPSNAGVWDPKEKVELLYIFSIPDKKVDMIVFG